MLPVPKFAIDFLYKLFYYFRKPGSRLANIIDVTGANQYHGFLPVLVRNCIASLTKQTTKDSEANPSADSNAVAEEEYPFSDADFLSDVGISSQIGNDWKKDFPLPLATALFSFLYHLASYEVGGDALVSCGMMESLLQVINWHGVELEHITVRCYFIFVLLITMQYMIFNFFTN